MPKLTPYEQQRLLELNTWLERPPGWISRGLDRISSPAVRGLQNVVPPAAIQQALESSNQLAHKLADERSILKMAKLTEPADLSQISLQVSDRLARSVQRRAIAMAGGTGAVTGVTGLLGSAIDIPTLITLSLRSIHRTALCYGQRLQTEDNRALMILGLASANRQEERLAAMHALQGDSNNALALAAMETLEQAAHREIAKQSASASLTNLARQLGLNLGQRKAAGVVPILGAVISSSVNAWFVRDVCLSAQYAFTARKLSGLTPMDALKNSAPSV